MSYFEKQKEDQVYRLGNLELLEEQILCKWYGKNIELTKTEFALLKHYNQMTSCCVHNVINSLMCVIQLMQIHKFHGHGS